MRDSRRTFECRSGFSERAPRDFAKYVLSRGTKSGFPAKTPPSCTSRYGTLSLSHSADVFRTTGSSLVSWHPSTDLSLLQPLAAVPRLEDKERAGLDRRSCVSMPYLIHRCIGVHRQFGIVLTSDIKHRRRQVLGRRLLPRRVVCGSRRFLILEAVLLERN